MAGSVGATLPYKIGNIQVTFGSGGQPGVLVTNGVLQSLYMDLSTSLSVGGISFAKGNFVFTYTHSTDEFTLSGDCPASTCRLPGIVPRSTSTLAAATPRAWSFRMGNHILEHGCDG